MFLWEKVVSLPCLSYSVGGGGSSTTPPAQVQAEWRTIIPRKRKAESYGSHYDLLFAEDGRIASKPACLHKPAGTITLGDAVLGSHGPTKLGPVLSSRFGRR